MRWPTVLLAAALASPVSAALPSQTAVVVRADNPSYDPSADETILRGNASIQDGTTLLTADEIDYFRPTETIVAIGRATLTLAAPTGRGMRLLAASLVYRRTDGSFSAQDVRLGQHPFYVSGSSAQGNLQRVVIYQATVSYTEPGHWKPTIKAESVIFTPGHFIRLGTSRIGVAGVAMLPLWNMAKTLDESALRSYTTFTGGYRSRLGAIGGASLRIPIASGVRVGVDADLYTSRGLMIGPGADYAVQGDDQQWMGSLRTGYIWDYGKRGTDILGDPISHNRAFADWQQQAQLSDNLTLDGELNWWSDSFVYDDFHPKEYYTIQQPDNFLEAVDTGADSFASVFTRFNPNPYEPVQQRLPEVRYDMLPSAIGGGFYERLNVSAVSLLEQPPDGGQELRDDRLDLFYGIKRPFEADDWFSFVPVLGGRFTDYLDTTGAEAPGGYLRALGEVGFDAELQASGTFDYVNKSWGIDGLRHLFTPIASYRYIPEADQGQDFIPPIDRVAFSPDLQPLELGDVPYLDTLQPTNTLRLGVDNTLQTRDQGYGSRDLAYFNVTDDLDFNRVINQQPSFQDHSRGFSEVHVDAGLSPEPWFTFDTATILSWRTLGVHEVESGFQIKDGDTWALHLGSDFLRHEDDAYIAEGMYRVNEVWRVRALAEYDARHNLFPTRALILQQDLANTWDIRYVLTFNSGGLANRTGHFGFQAELNLLEY